MISVDTKKKEPVGDFKNSGRELRPKGQPEPVRVHDFAILELGKAVPYGIYDVSANAGFVNLGISADTAAFSVASIRRWWHEIGAARYPGARQLLINADCGGSNGGRLRLWKRELPVLADELGSGDLPKWCANCDFCCRCYRCVRGARLRICISSDMRWRSGVGGEPPSKQNPAITDRRFPSGLRNPKGHF